MTISLSQKRTKRITDPSENEIQRGIVKAMRSTIAFGEGWTAFSIPNGGNGRNHINAYLMGELAGVADLIIISPDRIAHFMEVKTQSGSQSKEQKAFQLHCVNIGMAYEIARSIEDGYIILNSWGFPGMGKISA